MIDFYPFIKLYCDSYIAFYVAFLERRKLIIVLHCDPSQFVLSFLRTASWKKLRVISAQHSLQRLFYFSTGDYQLGANAAGFKKVADAMFAQGQVFKPGL